MSKKPKEDLQNTYLFLSELGFGAFGTVWKVLDKKSSDLRAIKLIKKHKALDPSKSVQSKLILDEIKALRRLNKAKDSENYIIKFYRFFIGVNAAEAKKEQEYFVIEMEYFAGIDLYDYVKQIQDLNLPYAFTLIALCKTIKHLIEAVDFVHQNGTAHRDIKPSNIMFAQDRLVLVDFGLACLFSECTGFVGTPGYIAPELYNCIKSDKGDKCKINWAKADVYSLGKTLQFLAMSAEFSTNIINDLMWKMTDNDSKTRPNTEEGLVMSKKDACKTGVVFKGKLKGKDSDSSGLATTLLVELEKSGLPTKLLSDPSSVFGDWTWDGTTIE